MVFWGFWAVLLVAEKFCSTADFERLEPYSRRRVCIVCGGKWVEWDVTSGGYEKITRVEYWQITAE